MQKETVYLASKKLLEEKIETAITLMDDAQASANQDTKSSAGDKHETSRAMAMLEKEKAANQLSELRKLQQALMGVSTNVMNTAEVGALIQLNTGWFYLAVGLGKIEVNKTSIFCISLASPLGTALLGKSSGEQISLNGRALQILQIL